MEKVFIDTSALYALMTPKDKFYNSANEYLESVIKKSDKKDITLITTDYVICETLNLINIRQGHKEAIEFLNSIENSQYFDVEDITKSNKDEAKKIFKKHTDKDYSFTDCTSFAFMRENEIKKAFAFDNHFIQFGFELVA